MVALGQLDAVIDLALKPYDIQALIPIIEGAGGVVSIWGGRTCSTAALSWLAATVGCTSRFSRPWSEVEERVYRLLPLRLCAR